VTATEPALTAPSLSFLPTLFREPRRPWLVLPIAYLLTISGSLLIASLIGLLIENAEQPDFKFLAGSGFTAVFVLAIATPLLETLILAATTSILLKFVKPSLAILLSSAGWAVAHSLQAPIWGLVIFWPFIIFTTLYVVWKKRSLAWGLFMPYAAHFLQNLLPSIGIGYPHLIPGIAS
jgi:hypothetical protein